MTIIFFHAAAAVKHQKASHFSGVQLFSGCYLLNATNFSLG
jgi:hypothetical protein